MINYINSEHFLSQLTLFSIPNLLGCLFKHNDINILHCGYCPLFGLVIIDISSWNRELYTFVFARQ